MFLSSNFVDDCLTIGGLVFFCPVGQFSEKDREIWPFLFRFALTLHSVFAFAVGILFARPVI